MSHNGVETDCTSGRHEREGDWSTPACRVLIPAPPLNADVVDTETADTIWEVCGVKCGAPT